MTGEQRQPVQDPRARLWLLSWQCWALAGAAMVIGVSVAQPHPDPQYPSVVITAVAYGYAAFCVVAALVYRFKLNRLDRACDGADTEETP